MTLCCGAIWRHRENGNISAQLQSILYTTAQKDFGKFTSCMTFGAHNLVNSEPFLDYLYEIWQLLLAPDSDMRKKFYIGAHPHIPAILLQWNFFQVLQLSIRSGAHKLFRRFFYFSQFLTAISRKLRRHLATNMRTMHLIEQSPVKETLKTASKSGNKRQRNACSNARCSGLQAWQTNKKTNTIFSHLQTTALCDLPQTLHGDRARRAHHKRCDSFIFLSNAVFATGCTVKFGLIYRRAVSQQ